MIYLGADHAGFNLKEKIKQFLDKKGIQYTDLGNKKLDPDDDYPVFGHRVAKKVARKGKGILICGSSHGVCIVANKVKGIRAVSITTVRDAKLSRQDDDANVLCLSGWHTSEEKAKKIIETWLSTPFSTLPRHKRRVEEIKEIEHAH